MHKILILGSTGMLGQAMVRTAMSNNFKFYTACRGGSCSFELDVLDFHNSEEDFIDFIKKNKISYVINCIGVLVQESSLKLREAIEINGLFPMRLASICSINKVNLIHISTDCVYSGFSAPIKRNQIPDPKDSYGISKYIGEFSKDLCMVLRTSIIGEDNSHKPQGLLNWVLSNNNTTLKGYTNAYWSGVTTDYLSYLVLEKIIKNSNYKIGRYNVATSCISKYELIQGIVDIYGLQISVERHELNSTIDKCLISDFDGLKDIFAQLRKEFI